MSMKLEHLAIKRAVLAAEERRRRSLRFAAPWYPEELLYPRLAARKRRLDEARRLLQDSATEGGGG